MDVITILKDLWRTKDLQQWVNHRFNDEKLIPVNKDRFESVVTKDGHVIKIDENLWDWQFIYDEYDLSDIRETDIVVDLGANVGAFTLYASKRCRFVTAVEPDTHYQLQKNLDANKVINVQVIRLPFGNKGIVEWEWKGKKHSSIATTWEGITFNKRVDWLKCDCEGGEWYLAYDNIKDIRRIEMELHHRNMDPTNTEMPDWLEPLKQSHDITFTKPVIEHPEIIGILHARKRE